MPPFWFKCLLILLYLSCSLGHLHLFLLCWLDVSQLPLCFAHQLLFQMCCFSFSVCNFPIPVVMILGNSSSCYVRSHFLLASVLYFKPSLFFLCLISAANFWVVITLTLCDCEEVEERHKTPFLRCCLMWCSLHFLFFPVINCHISG